MKEQVATFEEPTPYSFIDYQHESSGTAIYPEAGTGSQLALAYCALGLGEAGEIQNKVKKVIRDTGGKLTVDMTAEISKELGDILWYVAAMCREIKVPMYVIAEDNIRKLNKRKEEGKLRGSGDNR